MRYFAFETQFGKNENTCIWTEKPENPRENAVKDIEIGVTKSRLSLIMLQAELTSASDAHIRFIDVFSQTEHQSEMSAEKKIMYEETVIEDIPAFFIEYTKLNDCLVFSLEFEMFVFFILKIVPVIQADKITLK